MPGPYLIALVLGIGLGAASAVAIIHLHNRWRSDWRAWIESLSLLAVVAYSTTSYFQWRALTISNEQTQRAFRIANRAYLSAGKPDFDAKAHLFTLSMSNRGHLPTGTVEVVIHEATAESQSPISNATTDLDGIAEAHWRRHTMAPFPPDSDPVQVGIGSPTFAADKFTSEGALQQIFVTGRISYVDAFSEDGKQSYDFCYQSGYNIEAQRIFFTPCDPGVVLTALEKRDGFADGQGGH